MIARALAASLCVAPALLAQARPQPLDTVTVSVASRADAALGAPFRTVEVLARTEIERLPARTLGDVLARALGVEVPSRSAASADLSIRGSSFEQVLVLVDGVKVSDAQTGHFDLDLAVPLAMVERVEVLRGTGSALYGADAVGGVVNVVTRRDDASGFARGIAQAGSFETRMASLAAGGRAGATRVRAGADYAASAGHRAGTDYEIVQLRATAERALAGGRAGVDAGVGLRGFGAADFYGAFPAHERTSGATMAARWESATTGPWRVRANASARRHGDRFTLRRENPSAYQNRHTSWQTGAELVATHDVSRTAALALGGEAYDLRLASERLGDRTERRAAAFAEATLGRGRALGANAGARVDWSSEFGATVSPSLAARALVGATALRASVNRGHRTPTWTERYYEDPANVGDPTLQPERFWTGELGAATQVAGLRVDGAVFVRQADRLIDWARQNGAATTEPWRTRNVEDATFLGAELRADLPRALGAAWTVRLATLDVDAAAASGYEGKYALRPLTRSASLVASVPLGGALTFGADAGWAGHAGEPLFLRADARLAAAWRGFALTIDVVNLSDADYVDASAKPVAGRAVYVGVRWR